MTAAVQRGDRPATTARTVAQAKLNLLLRILAREAGGYHQLETLFCRLEIGDDVVVRTAVRGRSLDCAGDVMPAGGLGPVEQNLAWRAASAYADATGWPNDWAIEIGKRVPVGGGLGGGSADAGAVLRCLNALAPAPVSRSALLALAGPLGADVPFLTLEAPLAIGWGRGERLLTLAALPPRHVALVCFAFGVNTREAYGWVDTERGGALPEPGVLDADALATWDGIARLAHNDFEMVVAPRHPEIAGVLSGLRAAAPVAGDPTAITLLAGSGSTVAFLSRDSTDVAAHITGGGAVRTVHTRTASQVVAVEVSD